MTEKIPQHSHCRQCGKAYVGEGKYCSDGCKSDATKSLKKRKNQLLFLYIATFIILIIAVLAMSL